MTPMRSGNNFKAINICMLQIPRDGDAKCVCTYFIFVSVITETVAAVTNFDIVI